MSRVYTIRGLGLQTTGQAGQKAFQQQTEDNLKPGSSLVSDESKESIDRAYETAPTVPWYVSLLGYAVANPVVTGVAVLGVFALLGGAVYYATKD